MSISPDDLAAGIDSGRRIIQNIVADLFDHPVIVEIDIGIIAIGAAPDDLAVGADLWITVSIRVVGDLFDPAVVVEIDFLISTIRSMPNDLAAVVDPSRGPLADC